MVHKLREYHYLITQQLEGETPSRRTQTVRGECRDLALSADIGPLSWESRGELIQGAARVPIGAGWRGTGRKAAFTPFRDH